MKKKSTMAWISEFIAPYRFYYIASVFLALASVIFGFLPYFYIGQIIRDLFNGLKDGQVYLQACLWMAVFWLAYAICHALSTGLSHKATFVVLADIRFRLTEKLAKIPLGSVLSQSSGSYKNIIVERVEATETTLAHIIPEFTAALVGPLIVFGYMIKLDWRLTLLSFLTLPIGILFYLNMLRKSKGDYENTLVKTKVLNDTAVEYINGIEVIKIFGKEKFSYQKFVTAAKEGADCFIEWMRKCQFDMAAVTVIMPSVFVILLPVGAYFIYSDRLSQDSFILLMILSMGFFTPLITLGTYMDDIRKVHSIFGEITEILERPDLQRPQELSQSLQGGDIVLENVSFGYEEDKEVLHNISMTIKAGTVNALVGPSGSGKSTLAKLIASFWDVKSGRISLGGLDIREIPLEEYSRLIAYVSQDNFLFNDSILENIRLGKPSASDEEIYQVAKSCGCYDFIMDLENGFATQVGSAGGSLSGGERQRIAIARAMLKDAPIVILDEATAYTDPENEALVQSSIAQLVKGKTLIVIAHRLSTIADADQIILVNEGHLEALGKQEDLLSSSDLYQKMWQAHLSVRDTDRDEKIGGLAHA
ncbi:putative ABC transporter ATP-binding protein [Streptococcus criceti]|uniref:ABC transporter, permease/ATP-binding protein n=1 Tax=Streptococcus criceti HS-6 TaxID=873449 RepID=G5JSZ6_STRCG|nr:ABC transporter ATP-binding protein [Streptococcus criceti]EHI74517.1 ABC transporter, permease/ATP-binding protein [Streptococcus criceti HS-6]SUN43516.1 putative ABC transporter ATP-binding protein [Streptococcus criceti]